jgi:xeroderma pigmentosum group C-complementing protein
VITGIVVAEEQVEGVMAAFKESAAAAEEREKRKREERALKRWAKLINGLRVRERLREAYGGKEGVSSGRRYGDTLRCVDGWGGRRLTRS